MSRHDQLAARIRPVLQAFAAMATCMAAAWAGLLV
jgi:hypothetical protein